MRRYYGKLRARVACGFDAFQAKQSGGDVRRVLGDGGSCWLVLRCLRCGHDREAVSQRLRVAVALVQRRGVTPLVNYGECPNCGWSVTSLKLVIKGPEERQ